MGDPLGRPGFIILINPALVSFTLRSNNTVRQAFIKTTVGCFNKVLIIAPIDL